jgi:predicted transcriptional regulator
VTTKTATIRTPAALRRRVTELARDATLHREERERIRADRAAIAAFLERAPAVEAALEELGQSLFDELVGLIEEKLSIALQEVLEQPIRLRAEAAYKRGAASVEFSVDRGGDSEDILRGQGGSVVNVLSVGLRMFALSQLDPARHRPFLVLDEQDCWLRPDLVPRLVGIVREAARTLGFQVLMISHHDVRAFEEDADVVYRFVPEPDGVRVERTDSGPSA